jgi:hypothetical protein
MVLLEDLRSSSRMTARAAETCRLPAPIGEGVYFVTWGAEG